MTIRQLALAFGTVPPQIQDATLVSASSYPNSLTLVLLVDGVRQWWEVEFNDDPPTWANR